MGQNNYIHCRWCDEAGISCKAHIIPEYFFRQINKDGLIRLNDAENEDYKRVSVASPLGWFDRNIICDNCEDNVFKPIDNRVINYFFQKQEDFIIKNKSDGYVVYEFDGINGIDLYRYGLSVLWRCSVSSFISKVHLGKYLSQVKQEIKDPTFKFSVFIQKTLPSQAPFLKNAGIEEEVAKQMIEPYFKKVPVNARSKARLYFVQMADFTLCFYITDKKVKSKASFEAFYLKVDEPVKIMGIPYDESFAKEDMFRILNNTRKKTTL